MRVARLVGLGLVVTGLACSKDSTSYGGGGGGGGGGGIPPPAANQVYMQGTAFNPSTRTVTVGTTVEWVNQDPFAHTTTRSASPETWDSGTLNAGGRFSRLFNTAGSFSYICNIHGVAMSGTIVVNP